MVVFHSLNLSTHLLLLATGLIELDSPIVLTDDRFLQSMNPQEYSPSVSQTYKEVTIRNQPFMVKANCISSVKRGAVV